MSVALKGEAEFDLDGKQVKLVANVTVLLKAEQETGFGIFELLGRANTHLWVMASLLRHQIVAGGGEEMTLERASEVVLQEDAASKAVLVALAGALPAVTKEGDENPPKAARRKSGGTGTKS